MSNYQGVTFGGQLLVGSNTPYNYVRVVPVTRDVASTWLDIQEIRDQLNLYEDDSQDTYLETLDLVVRSYIEEYLGKAIFTESFDVYYGSNVLADVTPTLNVPYTQSSGLTVTSVSYYSNATVPVLTALPSSAWFYDPSDPKIVINSSSVPQAINVNITSPIVARITLAATPYATYPAIKHAGKLLLTHYYNNRAEADEKSLKNIPFGFDMLLRPYKDLVM